MGCPRDRYPNANPAMTAGIEWLVDARGCRPGSLQDVSRLRRLCAAIIAALDLHVVGNGMWHRFPPPGGVTGMFLLTESHLAVHTYPEAGLATFNLYCCRPRPGWPWGEELRRALGATGVTVRTVARGRTHTARRRIAGRMEEGG